MKKVFKNVLLLILAVALLTGTCGCGNQNAVSSEIVSSSTIPMENQMTESQMNEILQEENLYYTPSSIFSAETDSIWYVIDPEEIEKGKDGVVSIVYSFRNGKIYRYELSDERTLGKFAKMSDEEIILELENAKALNGITSELQQEISHAKEYIDLLFQDDKVTPLTRETAFQVYCNQYEAENYVFGTFGKLPAKLNFTCDVSQQVAIMKKYAEDLSTLEKWLQDHNCEAKAEEFAVFTDSTGNSVDYEQVTCEYEKPFLIDFAPFQEYESQEEFVEHCLKLLFDPYYPYYNKITPSSLNFSSLDDFATSFSRNLYFLEEDEINSETFDSIINDRVTAYTNFTVELETSEDFPEWNKCKVVYSGHSIDEDGDINLNFEITPETMAPNLEVITTGYDTIRFGNSLTYSPTCQVYDSFYEGYSIQINGEFSRLITRISGASPTFGLDYIGTEGVEIDPVESQAESSNFN